MASGSDKYRVGLIVPSSNTTMEVEVPEMLRAREQIRGEHFSVHSSRMPMRRVDPDELKKMDVEADRCVRELNDAHVDVMAYACLVAIMCQGPGYHRESESHLGSAANAPVVSSAGALVDALRHVNASSVAVIAPYVPDLTDSVVQYLRAEDITVTQAVSLAVADNIAVGRLDPAHLKERVAELDLNSCDALVLSACVQMPSLAVLATIQDLVNVPVVTAASATVWRILNALGLEPVVPGAGALLAGA
jgi:maleate isomerase